MSGQRSVLITGACGGVGRETAKLLARAGHTVAMVDRDPQALRELASELTGSKGRILAEPLDVTDAGETERVVRKVWGALGGVHVLINCAGILRLGQWDSLTLEDYRASMDVNFFGTLHAVQAVLPLMRRQGNGQIINMCSIAGVRGMPFFGAYSASKFAVYGYSQVLRDELKGTGIAVSVLCPPSIRTPMVTGQPSLPPIYHRFPWLSPAHVARRLAGAMETREFDVAVDLRTRALLLVNRLFPWLVDRMVLSWSR